MDRTLFLPLSIVDRDTREAEAFLSRQIPILIRNQFEEMAPGRWKASPLATESEEGRIWVLTTDPIEDATALELARRQRMDRVVFGTLGGPPGDRVPETRATRVLKIRALEVATGKSLFDRVFSGDIIRVVRAAVDSLSSLVPAADNSPFKFHPGTHTVEAFEQYLHGLDVLLGIRTDEIVLGAPDQLFSPFDRALDLDPCFEEVLTAGLTCAMLFAEGANRELPIEPALRTLARWERFFPEDRRIPAIRSELYVRRGRYEEALALVEAALAGPYAGDFDLQKRLGELQLQLGQGSQALETLEDCLTRREDSELRRRSIAAATAAGKLERARHHLECLLETEPDDPALWGRLADVQKSRGDVDAMWRCFAAMFQNSVGPDQTRLVQLVGELEGAAAPEEVREVWRRWYPPRDFGAKRRLLFARVLRLAGAPFEAGLCLKTVKGDDLGEEFELAISRERLNLARPGFDDRFEVAAHELSGDPGGSKIDGRFLEEALELEPTFWPARFLYSLWLSHRRDLDAAVHQLDIVTAQRPQSDLAWFTRGLQLLKAGRPREARSSLERALALKEGEGEYHCQIALCHLQLRDYTAARNHINRARELRVDHPDDDRVEAMIDAAAA